MKKDELTDMLYEKRRAEAEEIIRELERHYKEVERIISDNS